jgi:hypothetical protein
LRAAIDAGDGPALETVFGRARAARSKWGVGEGASGPDGGVGEAPLPPGTNIDAAGPNDAESDKSDHSADHSADHRPNHSAAAKT